MNAIKVSAKKIPNLLNDRYLIDGSHRKRASIANLFHFDAKW